MKTLLKIQEYPDIFSGRSKMSKCCIYFLILGRDIVYVGKSTNGGFDRIGAHLKYSDKEFDSYNTIPCPEDELALLETEYIIKFNPKYNKSLPSNSRYATASKIMSTFKLWTKQSFDNFTLKNAVPVYADKYYRISDFAVLGAK